jgi:germination protein M
MNRSRRLRSIVLFLFLVMPLVLGGCSLWKQEKTSQPIDPPQVLDGEVLSWAVDDLTEDAAGDSSGKLNTNVTVYLQDKNGFIVPVSLKVPEEIGIAKKTLQYLVKGGEYESELPEGFSALLPEGTKIDLDIKQDEKLAIVDFSKEFKNYAEEEERDILEAVTWTLTGFPTVDRVELRMQGETLKEMPVGGTPINGPLTRAVGINLEKAPGIEYGQSTPVTLYFTAVSPENATYFVPVTRLIQRTDNPVAAAMNELIAGPLEPSVLHDVMMPDTQVIDVAVQEDLVSVKLNDKALDSNNKVPGEMMQSIVLTLTETTGLNKVHIQVDGAKTVTATDNTDYSQPVDRPVHPNMLKS